jgi:hypothetical protein
MTFTFFLSSPRLKQSVVLLDAFPKKTKGRITGHARTADVNRATELQIPEIWYLRLYSYSITDMTRSMCSHQSATTVHAGGSSGGGNGGGSGAGSGVGLDTGPGTGRGGGLGAGMDAITA